MLTLKLFNKTITDIEVGGIDMSDYPKFCDAYIESALVNGVEATEAELEDMTDCGEFLYEAINHAIH